MEAMFLGAVDGALSVIAAVGISLAAVGLAVSGIKYQISTNAKGSEDAITWGRRVLIGLACTLGPKIVVGTLRSWIGV